MPWLRESVARVPAVRPTDLGQLLAPHVGLVDPANPLTGLEPSAVAILIAVLKGSGRQLREEMVRDRSRSRRLEQLVYVLPEAARGGNE
jgi:hypothetical protein